MTHSSSFLIFSFSVSALSDLPIIFLFLIPDSLHRFFYYMSYLKFISSFPLIFLSRRLSLSYLFLLSQLVPARYVSFSIFISIFRFYHHFCTYLSPICFFFRVYLYLYLLIHLFIFLSLSLYRAIDVNVRNDRVLSQQLNQREGSYN